MGTTPDYALPYPEGSDPPQGHVQLRALAEAVEAALVGMLDPDLRIQAGEAAGGPSNSGSFQVTVTFPEPFAAAPVFAVANIATGAGASSQWNVRVISQTATTLTIFGYSPAGAATWSGPLQWLAIGRR